MAEFAIREAVAEDTSTILGFLRLMVQEMSDLGGHAASQEEDVWRRLGETTRAEVEKGNHLYLLAELRGADSTAVGLAEAGVIKPAPVFDIGQVLHIHALYVLPSYRRAGVARMLLAALLDWGQGQGCSQAELNVLQSSPARFLYQAVGFQPFQIEMRREL